MKSIIFSVLLSFGLASASWALTTEEKFIVGLQAQGFKILQQERTLFGRIRVVAQNEKVRREMVVNRNTGEILRDYSVLLADVPEAQSEREVAGISSSDPAKDGYSTAASAAGAGSASMTIAGSASMTIGVNSTSDVYVVEERRGRDGGVEMVVIFISPVDVSNGADGTVDSHD